ncbi:MAG: HisA/HisF-related TIM barrel protein [Candidatus Micrarchaeota archaeon]|nr:HisA/HisF-related TIM barrel protein [Candidatus Micrarchaeota archaeon]
MLRQNLKRDFDCCCNERKRVATLAKRIIPCLDCDVRNGRVVVLKGTKFQQLRFAGDPVELAGKYQDADELVLLDIGATVQARGTFLGAISDVAAACSIPLCVGGGVRTFSDFEQRIKRGADQCAVNTAALENPGLIAKCAREFGSQAVVVAVDAKLEGGDYYCYARAGREKTRWKMADWLRETEKQGAGEILLTSIDRDGTGQGFDIGMLNAACAATSLPVIASGGCSSVDDIAEVFQKTEASGALAASIFHFGKITVKGCKRELLQRGVEVRI